MKIFKTMALNLKGIPLKYVSFEGFKGINYHLDKDSTVLLTDIYSGNKELAPASFLVDEPMNEKVIEAKILYRQSKERVKESFENDFLSASMTTEEMLDFQELLEKENFVAKRVIFIHKGKEYKSFPSLPLDLQKGIFKDCVEQLGLETVILKSDEDETEESLFDKTQKEVYKIVNENFIDEQLRKNDKSVVSKEKKKEYDKKFNKALKKTLAISFGTLILRAIEYKFKDSKVSPFFSIFFKLGYKMIGAFLVTQSAHMADIKLKGGELL